MRARVEKIREAEREDVQWNAQQLEKEMESFAKTAAYRALWSRDKKVILEFRRALSELAPRGNLAQPELLALVAPFGDFVQSLERVNLRAILQGHDREAWAAIGVKLELAEQLLGSDEAQVRKLFGEAVTVAYSLYGRDAQLDGFLRKAKKAPVNALPEPELQISLEAFRELISNLPIG